MPMRSMNGGGPDTSGMRTDDWQPNRIEPDFWVDRKSPSTIWSGSAGSTRPSTGDTVGKWDDKSHSFTDRTVSQSSGGSRPTFIDDGIDFNGDDQDNLVYTDNSTQQKDFSFSIVARRSDWSVGSDRSDLLARIDWADNTAGINLRHGENTGEIGIKGGSTVGFTVTATVSNQSGYIRVSALQNRIDSSTVERTLRVTGSQVDNNTGNWKDSTDTIELGQLTTTSWPWPGDIYGCILFNARITDAKMEAIEDYFYRHYGLHSR